jgi:serine/threonine protein kinase
MATTPPAPDGVPQTADDFFRTVLRSGLLDRDQLQAALRGVPRELRGDAPALADHLVKSGKLSRFQAKQLLKGTALGLVLGPYQVLAPIGKGSMGTVYLARHQTGGQLVALKVLPPRRARNEERLLERFLREMDLSQRVSHPHLAWTYEVGEFRGAHYIAMEYIPGQTLSRLVKDQGPLPVARAARLMAEVASGLEHAHQQKLIHRDLKPSNIQVTPRDHAKVLDLGLALTQGETGDSEVVGGQGYIVGSMDYIAPEQTVDATGVDPRCDLYSLGCTLYFALTGQPPFPGGTNREKIQRHRREKPTPLAELRPDLPKGFVALVERLMEKDPRGRPASAAAAAEELRAWAASEPAPPPDRQDDQVFDETVARLQSGSSADMSVAGLSFLEKAQEEDNAPAAEATPWPGWVVPVLSVGVGLLLGGLLALLYALFMVRG